MPLTYLGISMTMENKFVWVANDTKKLAPFGDTYVRNLWKMSEIVQDYGMLTSQGVLVAPFAPRI